MNSLYISKQSIDHDPKTLRPLFRLDEEYSCHLLDWMKNILIENAWPRYAPKTLQPCYLLHWMKNIHIENAWPRYSHMLQKHYNHVTCYIGSRIFILRMHGQDIAMLHDHNKREAR